MLLNTQILAISIFALPSLSSILQRRSPSVPTVQTLNGTYSGVHSSVYDQDFFLGIPFAQPPVGDLRFRQAQSLNSSWSDSKPATSYSKECIGYGSDQWVLGNDVSEDCLTLNVVRPSGVSGKLPVAVWIHGGGFYQGGNADPRYNLSFIVQQSVQAETPFIGISINYRLQAWGFLFGKEVLEDGSANIAIRDQRLALQWVQENIAAFGGDSTQVTIWGESAGGFSVGAQLIAYGGRNDGLFRSAISQSGGPIGLASTLVTPESWQPTYDNITKAANCSTAADSLDCLRKVPTDVLSSIFNSTVTAGAKFSVVIDHDIIMDSGTNSVANGKFVKVPYLQGTNNDEGASFGQRGINTTEQFLSMITSSGVDNTTATILAAVYPDIPAIGIPPTYHGRPPASKLYGSQFKRVAAYAGDVKMQAPRRLAAQLWAKYNATTYSYVFHTIPNGIDSAAHFQEVAFVFHNLNGDGYRNVVAKPPFEGKPQTFTDLSTMMSRMWISFIINGDPNKCEGNFSSISGIDIVTDDYIVSNVAWPKYTLDDPTNIVFDTNVTNLAYISPDIYRAEGIDFVSKTVLKTQGII